MEAILYENGDFLIRPRTYNSSLNEPKVTYRLPLKYFDESYVWRVDSNNKEKLILDEEEYDDYIFYQINDIRVTLEKQGIKYEI
ncbi:hypothetical protein GCM10025886_20810 [Tetragenococcus halophilus subsp. flandriensis]|uniref:hypothetical protein n=1 Tax=Tetragenococcus halophilus TaxID=51669 RepID=UPI0023E92C59|nr:hypothetical protein [Tetragenococcus halophilus]GMA08930.1 hypothetical protein GCM10025886_20810 [Tetragenococcus halophilus subsp. flandriensis]